MRDEWITPESRREVAREDRWFNLMILLTALAIPALILAGMLAHGSEAPRVCQCVSDSECAAQCGGFGDPEPVRSK